MTDQRENRHDSERAKLIQELRLDAAEIREHHPGIAYVALRYEQAAAALASPSDTAQAEARVTAAARLGIDIDSLAYMDRVFNSEACLRLAHSTQDYYSTHGEYVPPLAKLILVERAAALVSVRSVTEPEEQDSGSPDGSVVKQDSVKGASE